LDGAGVQHIALRPAPFLSNPDRNIDEYADGHQNQYPAYDE